MEEDAVYRIAIPNADGRALEWNSRILVIVGANGTGKTRLGLAINDMNQPRARFHSGNRMIFFPGSIAPSDVQSAYEKLKSNRGTGQQSPDGPAAQSLLPLVLHYLVSDNYEKTTNYVEDVKAEPVKRIEPPQTILDTARELWRSIMPHRELRIQGMAIRAVNPEGSAFTPSGLSEGERSAFSLIADVLSVPENGIFIVDEPELHLHRAIQVQLWDALESARRDCVFVYITHDLNFAASRRDAKKLWITGFRFPSTWDWKEIPEDADAPEGLLLEVAGSRRPILFIESEPGKLDQRIYSYVYPQFHIVPCGSCDAVVHSTKSMNRWRELHHNTCYGLVDYDGRADEMVAKYQEWAVRVTPAAMIECVLVMQPVLAAVANRVSKKGGAVIGFVMARLLESFARNAVSIASNLSRQEIEARSKKLGKLGDGRDAIEADFRTAFEGINPAAIYEKWDAECQRVVAQRDFHQALRLYKTKECIQWAAAACELKSYPGFICRCIADGDGGEILAALRSVAPKFG